MDWCNFYTMLTLQFDASLATVDIWEKAIAGRIAGTIQPPQGPAFGTAFAAAKTIVDRRRVVQGELRRLRAAAKKAVAAGAAIAPWVRDAIDLLTFLLAIIDAEENVLSSRDHYAALKKRHCE